MKQSTVFLLEDVDSQRVGLTYMLRQRGFDVLAAKNVDEARKLIEKSGNQIDVAILDMRLRDPDHPGISGADLGLELLERAAPQMPEFLIYSMYSSKIDYYKKAVRLGAAAYLDKSREDAEELIRHVRALAFRRALSPRDGRAVDAITKLVAQGGAKKTAVEQFCRTVVAEELTSTLGTPFFLLLREGPQGEVRLCGGSALPEESEKLCRDLVELAYLPGDFGQPVVLSRADAASLRLQGAEKIGECVALIPLAEHQDLQLVLGLVDQDSKRGPLAEDIEKLGVVLLRYCRRSVLHHFLDLKMRLAKAEEERRRAEEERRGAEEERRILIEATSKILLRVGQEELAILQDAGREGEIQEEGKNVRQLWSLAADLQEAGEVLSDLGGGRTPEAMTRVDVEKVVHSLWQEITADGSSTELEIEESGAVETDSESFYLVASQILRWLAKRGSECITIAMEEEGPETMIRFEDSSERIPTSIRRRLFDPFSLGIRHALLQEGLRGRRFGFFLAKLMIETRADGRLEDLSDELPGDQGHRFCLYLPKANPVAP